MLKENIKNMKGKEDYSTPKIVNKKNYHLLLYEFNSIISKPKKKFLFFNIDFSNLKNFTKENFQPDTYLLDYLQEINRIKEQTQNETQIIYTEFLICLESKKKSTGIKLYTYLIPSIKFHKFSTRESYLSLNPDSLNYFYFNKSTYPFHQICQIDSISYTPLQNKEKIEINLDKILSHGKPSKKENTKSYYFFPKNILVPTKDKQSELVRHIQECFSVIKEMTSTTETSIDDYAIKTIVTKDIYIAERIVSFDWRLLANQLDKNVIKGEIEKCLMNAKRKNFDFENEKFKIIQIYLNFLNELIEYIKDIRKIQSNNFSVNLPNFFFDSPNTMNHFSKKFLYNWKIFMELYFTEKISIDFLNVENEMKKIEFEFKIIKRTEKIDEELTSFENFLTKLKKFLNDDFNHNTFEESNIFKNENLKTFDILKLIPIEIAELLELMYIVNITINLKYLKEISLDKDVSTKFNYEELFFNMNNEKEILFDYNLETELYKLITDVGKIISCKITESSPTNIIHFDNIEFFKDFYIMSTCSEEKITEAFDNCIINLKINKDKRQFFFAFNNKDKNKLSSFLSSFKDNEKSYKYKFMKIFYKFKKDMVIEDEFGLSNFFKFFMDFNQLAKNHLTIVASNILFKFCFIYLEFFSGSNGINYNDFIKFFSNSHLNFIDLNYLTELKGEKLINEMNKIKCDSSLCFDNSKISNNYVTHKNFLILSKFIKDLNGLDININDNRIIFLEESFSNYRNKILVNQIRLRDNLKFILDKTGIVRNEVKGEEKNLLNRNKIYLSKIKYDSMEHAIEKFKEYGDFMINTWSDIIEINFIQLEKPLDELILCFNNPI